MSTVKVVFVTVGGVVRTQCASCGPARALSLYDCLSTRMWSQSIVSAESSVGRAKSASAVRGWRRPMIGASEDVFFPMSSSLERKGVLM